MKERIIDEDLDLVRQTSELKDYIIKIIFDFYNNKIDFYLSDLF